MRILALEPYYGGSHQAFLDGWAAHSRHEFTLLSLPPYKWKWRMRHAPVTFAQMVAERIQQGQRWDALFCSDMLNLAEFRGLAPANIAALPAVVYFHENQLTYPQQQTDERDLHFAYTNITTAHAADAVWFNSAYHRDAFLTAAAEFLSRMPDYRHDDIINGIRRKSSIHPPGIEPFLNRGPRSDGPLHILWAARWEHDKNSQDFFGALEILDRDGVDFQLSVIGESFEQVPEVFATAKNRFAARIVRWGYQPSRADYAAALSAADVAVSTAIHEFFGISILEATAAGAFPLAPRRLAYPETLSGNDSISTDDFFYDGTIEGLASALRNLAKRHAEGNLWSGDPERGRAVAVRYLWNRLAGAMDGALDLLL